MTDLEKARQIAAKQIGWETYEDAAAHNHHTEEYVSIALVAIQQTRADIIKSLREDFDEWPDYVALSDVADSLENPWATTR